MNKLNIKAGHQTGEKLKIAGKKSNVITQSILKKNFKTINENGFMGFDEEEPHSPIRKSPGVSGYS